MIFLTPSKMNLMNECPRCFYLNAKKIAERPRGIMSSLPITIDDLLKKHYDDARISALGMPEELISHIEGRLFQDAALIKKYRHWNNPLKVVWPDLDITLRGAIDDLFVENDGTYSVLDYKTKGTEPDPGYGEKYYQEQIDLLTLMLKRAGYEMSGKAYLAYYFLTGDVPLSFKTTVLTMSASAERGEELIARAHAILSGDVPAHNTNCEYCMYALNAK